MNPNNARLTAPERIRQWVEANFSEHRREEIIEEFIDVATGNREGNRFVLAALDKIFPEWATIKTRW